MIILPDEPGWMRTAACKQHTDSFLIAIASYQFLIWSHASVAVSLAPQQNRGTWEGRLRAFGATSSIGSCAILLQ